MALRFPLLVGNQYIVSWKDSGTHHADGWQTREEILDSAAIETVTSTGYCFQVTPDSIYLAQTWDKGKVHFFGTQVIQIANIVDLWTISKNQVEADADD
jgi:hypothetical protein